MHRLSFVQDLAVVMVVPSSEASIHALAELEVLFLMFSLPLLSTNFRYLKELALASAGLLLNRAAERKMVTSFLVHFLWMGGTLPMGLWILLLSATCFREAG